SGSGRAVVRAGSRQASGAVPAKAATAKRFACRTRVHGIGILVYLPRTVGVPALAGLTELKPGLPTDRSGMGHEVPRASDGSSRLHSPNSACIRIGSEPYPGVSTTDNRFTLPSVCPRSNPADGKRSPASAPQLVSQAFAGGLGGHSEREFAG